MVGIVFVSADGGEREVEAPVGATVMLAAIRNDIRGIDAECGGSLNCATCHVYLDPACLPLVPGPSDDEAALLAHVSAERRPTSRLSCQIAIAPGLPRLRVALPEHQTCPF